MYELVVVVAAFVSALAYAAALRLSAVLLKAPDVGWPQCFAFSVGVVALATLIGVAFDFLGVSFKPLVAGVLTFVVQGLLGAIFFPLASRSAPDRIRYRIGALVPMGAITMLFALTASAVVLFSWLS